MFYRLSKKIRDSKGATAIEYALIASLISVVAIAGMKLIGNTIGQKFNEISNDMNWDSQTPDGSGTGGDGGEDGE
ncbi:MAG: Flp family type IVb pilin [Holosporaceae bacterium]|jgi:pilus assembly protein Flp/PilA|nr:Flp family type IVb pilin [Holosporaceae bacterium]